ncbi:MAG: methyltransferase domain-containing protein [Acidobacteriota bacterium]
MFHLETTYWWFVGRRALVRDWVAAALRHQPVAASERWLLDAGCGTGANADMLRAFGRVIGTDISPQALHWSRQRGLAHLACCRVEKLCFADDTFDIVTALDMLEHVEDDMAALAELHRVCKPGSAVIITVPAYGFLWSPHDEVLHHRRRYAPRELRDKLQATGFEVERLSHFMCGLFLPVLLLRFWQSLRKQGIHPQSDLRPLPRWLNRLLGQLLQVERWLIGFFNLPIGVSLICTARKRDWVRSLVKRRSELAYDFTQHAFDDAYINRLANEPHALSLEFSRSHPVYPARHERDR